MTDKAPAASDNTTASGRKRPTAPAYANVGELMEFVQTHRADTVNDTSRQFTNGCFKSAGGIDSLPVTTRGAMAAMLLLSIASNTQDDETDQADSIIGIVGEFAGNAQQQAKDVTRLAAYENIAKLDGQPLRTNTESIGEFVARISKHVAKQSK